MVRIYNEAYPEDAFLLHVQGDDDGVEPHVEGLDLPEKNALGGEASGDGRKSDDADQDV